MTSCTSGIVSCVISDIPRVFPPRLESSWTTSLTPNNEADNSADFGAIHRNSCSVDWMIGIAVLIISLTVLSILNVPASSVGAEQLLLCQFLELPLSYLHLTEFALALFHCRFKSGVE